MGSGVRRSNRGHHPVGGFGGARVDDDDPHRPDLRQDVARRRRRSGRSSAEVRRRQGRRPPSAAAVAVAAQWRPASSPRARAATPRQPTSLPPAVRRLLPESIDPSRCGLLSGLASARNRKRCANRIKTRPRTVSLASACVFALDTSSVDGHNRAREVILRAAGHDGISLSGGANAEKSKDSPGPRVPGRRSNRCLCASVDRRHRQGRIGRRPARRHG